MAEVDTLCKSLEKPDNEEIHLRFVSELFDDSNEFELSDPTEEFDKVQNNKGDKVINEQDMEEDKKQN